MELLLKHRLSVLQPIVLVGAVVLARVAFVVLRGAYRSFVRPAKNLKKMGKWGVITGASDGIGKALATELARNGLNVLLISRTQSKLDDLQKEIKAMHSVEIRTLAIDFSQLDEAARNKITVAIKSIEDVGVLINNVGMSYDFCEYFSDIPQTTVENLIKLNVESTTWMTYLILPGMQARRRGAIVNLSSGSARFPSPLLTEYAATKKYVEHFTESLHAECASKGIKIQCHIPMFVTTKLSKIRHPSFFIPSPETYAKSAVANIGYESLCSPYWPHALQLSIFENIPSFLFTKLVERQHLSIRKRALKKKAEKSE